MLNQTYKLIQSICKEFQIKTINIDNLGLILKKDNTIKYVIGYNFDLNSCGAKLLCDNKHLLTRLLIDNKIATVESTYFDIIHNRSNLDSKDLLKLLKVHSKIVCKANGGTMGYQVFQCLNQTDCKNIFNYFLDKSINFIVNPFINIISEFRVVILNNKIELIYEKVKRIIEGNGKSTILELINKEGNYNEFILKESLNPGRNLNEILPDKELLEYSWKNNLANGCIPNIEINNKDHKKIKAITNKVLKLINGLNFASIDIIKTNKDEFKVLEINSGMMMERFSRTSLDFKNITEQIYKRAICSMMNIDLDPWNVYLIKNKNCTYVGATPDTKKRIRKHNGELPGGAKYTKSKGPGWEYVCIISGFTNKIDALRFEWAFKHQKPKKASGLKNRIKKLKELIKKEKWTESSPLSSTVPLKIYWIKPELQPGKEDLPSYITFIDSPDID
ncbi:hypothetical protein CPAV1605_1241 [seawater metagenome]|uniref:GIY-YIG domain-containing protein n=1 Tax=seawater metagenome TaxID=1561972 RepID=A0A5E8CMH9_9ZZZZ